MTQLVNVPLLVWLGFHLISIYASTEGITMIAKIAVLEAELSAVDSPPIDPNKPGGPPEPRNVERPPIDVERPGGPPACRQQVRELPHRVFHDYASPSVSGSEGSANVHPLKGGEPLGDGTDADSSTGISTVSLLGTAGVVAGIIALAIIRRRRSSAGPLPRRRVGP